MFYVKETRPKLFWHVTNPPFYPFLFLFKSRRALLRPGRQLRRLHLLLLSGNSDGVQHNGKGEGERAVCWFCIVRTLISGDYLLTGRCRKCLRKQTGCGCLPKRSKVLSGAAWRLNNISAMDKHRGRDAEAKIEKQADVSRKIHFWGLNISQCTSASAMAVHTGPMTSAFSQRASMGVSFRKIWHTQDTGWEDKSNSFVLYFPFFSPNGCSINLFMPVYNWYSESP